MSWSCSGTSNAELVNNLFRAGIIASPRVRDAMLSVRPLPPSPAAAAGR
jgi:protein-L-isoaspartate(D-aspartate) O-methyltransferase